MPKHIYCAQCGLELAQLRKAIKSKGIIVDLVEPHNCSEDINDIPEGENEAEREITPINTTPPDNADELFEKFKFVKKINNLNSKDKTKSNSASDGLKDKRSSADVKSTAPSIFNDFKNLPTSRIDRTEDL